MLPLNDPVRGHRPRPAARSIDPDLAAVLEALSLVLLGIFLASVLVSAWPPKLQDPNWQLGLIQNLINNGSLALMGALLTHLVIAFHPGSDRLRARHIAFSRWALAAALGFLMLIPLQVSAGWKLYRTFDGNSQQQISQSAKQLTALRQAITTATSTQEIQAKMQKLLGNKVRLTPTQLSTPINQLRQELLIGLDQASNGLQQRIEAQSSFNPDGLIKESIRIALSALFYAAGFAFLSGFLSPSLRRPTTAQLEGSNQPLKDYELIP
jgi:hypothetical protein